MGSAIPPALDPAAHRALAVGLFNRGWQLLGQAARTRDEDAELIHTAHASLYHWLQVGNAANRARGEWMCARVYSVLSRGEPALFHAREALRLVEAGGDGFEDWDLASALQGLAHACLAAGDHQGAIEAAGRSRAALARVADAGDREVVEAQLNELGL